MTQDSIFDNDQGWQSFAKAVRDRGRDWLHLRTSQAGLCDPLRNYHTMTEQALLQDLSSWGAQQNQNASFYYRHPYGPAYSNSLFGSLFGAAF